MMAENFRKCITAADDGQQAATLLCNATGLSRSRIKDAMQKGAVWLKKKGRGKNRRLRRATTKITKDDTLFIYYDQGILQTPPLSARLVADRQHYSVWEKPAGMLCQGTEYGDHCSLLRLAELFFAPRRPVFLLHRLDREASGLVLIGHSKKAAAHFSALFKEKKIDKRYLALVAGCPGPVGSEHTVTTPLDDKQASTNFTVMAADPSAATSQLDVRIDTGRLHQIRRHLAGIGHPLVGDGLYGRQSPEGMLLTAVQLGFTCPFSGRRVEFKIQNDECKIWDEGG